MTPGMSLPGITSIGRSGREHWAKHWDNEEHRAPVVHPAILRALQRSAGDVRGKRILEVGAGMGGDSIALAKQTSKVCAVDYLLSALGAIAEFAQRDRVDIQLVQADATALPFSDERFDAVFHQGLLEHFQPAEQYRVLRENWRVLRHGGTLVVDVPQKYSEYTWYKRKLLRQDKWFAGWETEFSPRSLACLVRNAGFSIQSVYPREYFGVMARVRAAFAYDTSQSRRRWAPPWFRKLYQGLWQWSERSGLAAYVSWSVGVIAAKP